ncbi:MAG: MarR family transcriptional regulator [Clostridia bacterium]|nr:MarR family transcriptional regulator [Clostridia bacterium]
MERGARSTFCRIKAVSNVIRRRIEGINIEEKFGLTGAECAIMGYLFENMEGPLYQKDVEEEFHIRRSSATRTLQAMEKKGIILRQGEPHDGRLKRLVLTERAMEIGRDVGDMIAEAEQRLLRGISDRELNAFLDMCERICRNADGGEGEAKA